MNSATYEKAAGFLIGEQLEGKDGLAAAMLSILLAPQAAVALSKRISSAALLSAYFLT
mgnify:CR=1 FL=1